MVWGLGLGARVVRGSASLGCRRGWELGLGAGAREAPQARRRGARRLGRMQARVRVRVRVSDP